MRKIKRTISGGFITINKMIDKNNIRYFFVTLDGIEQCSKKWKQYVWTNNRAMRGASGAARGRNDKGEI